MNVLALYPVYRSAAGTLRVCAKAWETCLLSLLSRPLQPSWARLWGGSACACGWSVRASGQRAMHAALALCALLAACAQAISFPPFTRETTLGKKLPRPPTFPGDYEVRRSDCSLGPPARPAACAEAPSTAGHTMPGPVLKSAAQVHYNFTLPYESTIQEGGVRCAWWPLRSRLGACTAPSWCTAA